MLYIAQHPSVQSKKYQKKEIWERSADVKNGQESVKKETQLKKMLQVGKKESEENKA